MAKDTTTSSPADAGKAPAAPASEPVSVWFLVTKNAARIGDFEHAKGKRMKLPKAQAEEAAKQGLGVLDGVA